MARRLVREQDALLLTERLLAWSDDAIARDLAVKRTRLYPEPQDAAVLRRPDGTDVAIPVVQGILKHLDGEELKRLLQNPDVALKYTLEALRIAPWPVLRHFPRAWLLECLPKAGLPEGRARAVAFMLSASEPAA